MLSVPEDYISHIWLERQQRYARRMQQARRVRDVLTNDMDLMFRNIVKPDEEPVVGNLIWAAARTISQRVGRQPRIDVQPISSKTDSAKAAAEKHEARLNDYSIKMNLGATRLQAAYWLITHDLAPLVVTPSPSYGIPIIEVRDPMTCYPGTVWPHKPEMVDVLFANKLTPWAAKALYPKVDKFIQSMDEQVESVVLGEYFDGDGLTVCLLEPQIRKLDYIPNPVKGRSMVVLTRGFSPDLDFHGQFDHVIAALIAQAKLFSLVMAYASQQVSSETVVVGEISSNQGRWAAGPGAVNTITPMPGAQASKLTNNMSVQVFNELDRLERAIRLGGQFPAQLSGEPVASIATGRGLEQLTLTVDDNVAYWQSVLDDAFMRCYSLIPPIAKAMVAAGADDFDPDTTVFVRSLSGADPAETVRLLQMQGARNLSRLTIMDRLPEVDSPIKELERLDVDEMRTTLIHSIDAQIQNQQLPADVVAKMIQRRKKGEEVEDIWLDVQKIQIEQQQQNQMVAQQAGGGRSANPQSLQDLLNPAQLTQAAQRQSILAARQGPEATQARQAMQGPVQPGSQLPGGTAVPA